MNISVDLYSAYNPPSASTPDANNSNMDLNQPVNVLSHADTSFSRKTSDLDDGPSPLREQAKDALRSLANHNIRYDKLIGEGINPHILQQLYEDLDGNFGQMKLASSAAGQKPSLALSQPAITDIAISVDSVQTADDLLPHSTTSISQASPLMPANLDPKSHVIDADSSSANQPSPIAVETSRKSPTALASGQKIPVPTPASSVALERKDRIAQLLAAKTGKPVITRPILERVSHPPVKVTLPGSTSMDPASLTASLPRKPPITEGAKQVVASLETPIPADQVKQTEAPGEKLPPPAEPSAKAKNKAQTELIRRKMEALRKEALAKAQAQASASSAPAVPISATAVPPTPQVGRADLTTDTIRAETNGFASQIPGLFMTSEVLGQDPKEDAKEQVGDIQGQIQTDLVGRNSANDAPDDVPLVDRESGNDHVSDRPSVPLRVSQKRPLASDSFDDAMPSLKRPFGRKDSGGRAEIVISDGVSEGEIDDVEMDLDEDSGDEDQPGHNYMPSAPSRESNIRNLPPLNDFPSPRQAIPSTSSIGTPTSTAIQTPGTEKEKEELWRAKNQEIELMRKKIAEMEERRKAKQNATRIVSPKAPLKSGLHVIRTSLTRPSQSASPGLARPLPATAEEMLPATLKSPILAASRPADLPSTPSTPLSAIKDPLRAEDLRQKLLRRRTTREGTPSTADMELRQAQLAEKRAKLAELRREAERREAEILEETRMLEAQLQAGFEDEQVDTDQLFKENGILEETRSDSIHDSSNTSPPAYQEPENAHVSAKIPSAMQSPTNIDLELMESDTDIVPTPPTEEAVAETLSPIGAANPFNVNREDLSAASEKSALKEDIERVEEVEAAEPFKTESPPHGQPDHVEERPIAVEYGDALVDDTPLDTFDSNLDDDGSVSMSDSGSEDYQPAEPLEPQNDPAGSDSDPYEPADVPLTEDAMEPSILQPRSISQPAELEDPNQAEYSHAEFGPSVHSPHSDAGNEDQPMVIDDSEDDMQLTEPDVINRPQIISQSLEDETNSWVRKQTSLWCQVNQSLLQVPEPMSHFTPYETPRRYFKNFRYYDQFPEMVADGYKSLTFSNSIDPKRPFCSTELLEGICEDPTCEEQHFRQIAMTGACDRPSLQFSQ
jgi:Putative zinc-finger domain